MDRDPVLVDEAEAGQLLQVRRLAHGDDGRQLVVAALGFQGQHRIGVRVLAHDHAGLRQHAAAIAPQLVVVGLGPVGMQKAVQTQVRHQHQPSHADSLPEVAPAGEVDHPFGCLGWGAWSDSGAAAPTGRGGPVDERARVSSTSTSDGKRLSPDDAQRVKDLVIPPAWQDVWICPWPNGHLQAVGTDDAGRRQYLYHPDWRTRRDGEKFQKMVDVREGAVEGPRAGAGRPRRRGDDAGACVRGRRTAARPRVLPDRQRRLRRGEQQLRAHHARAAARPARGEDAGLRLRGEVRDRAP